MIWRGKKRMVPPQILSERKNFYTWMYKFAGPGGDEKQTGPVIKGLSIGRRCCHRAATGAARP